MVRGPKCSTAAEPRLWPATPPASVFRVWARRLPLSPSATRTTASPKLASFTGGTPVKNLTFSGDVVWTYVDQKYQGLISTSGSTVIGKPETTYVLGNAGNVTAMFRAQRNF